MSVDGDDDRLVAKCYLELAEVTKEKGDYDESLRYHRKSLEIFERIDDPLSVADTHLEIADIYKAKGELKQAMSEYEKGLSLYEDALLDESNRNSDYGTDHSMNSSCMSDLQHNKLLSKSDETLSRPTVLIDHEDRPNEPVVPPEETPNSSPMNEEKSHLHFHKLQRCVIGFVLILLTGAVLWSISNSVSPLSTYTFPNASNDDLTEQLRKYLFWRPDRWSSLSKANRRWIEEYLSQSETRRKISLDKFQRLLELLDLKMVLVPR